MDGRIVCDEGSRSTVPSIYAVGDVVDGFPELTPAAIKAGEILARRLFGGSQELMNIRDIPTTVFTPMEYGCVGLSEEAAVAEYGEDDVEIYLSEFSPLEISACHRQKVESTRADDADVDLSPPCLSKLVCIKSEGMRVRGVHFVGPNAGELLQGMAIAVRLGAKKSDFDNTVGIHPTNAECFTQLTITKRSGKDWVAAGGCGGGKCGGNPSVVLHFLAASLYPAADVYPTRGSSSATAIATAAIAAPAAAPLRGAIEMHATWQCRGSAI
ncbi:hypothetical protein ACSSS7_002622 [Eimeria intestinalis]